MDIAFYIARFLQDSGFGTIGDDIYVGQLPASTDGVYVLRSGGDLNNYLPVESTVLDIYVRNASALNAITALEQIKRHTHRMHTVNMGEAYIYSILVIGDVEAVERDAEYTKIYKITIQVMHRATSVIS